jgi:hypothetical protein
MDKERAVMDGKSASNILDGGLMVREREAGALVGLARIPYVEQVIVAAAGERVAVVRPLEAADLRKHAALR